MADAQLIAYDRDNVVADTYTAYLTVFRPQNVKEILIQLTETGESNAALYKITGSNKVGGAEVTLCEDVSLAAAGSEYETVSDPWLQIKIYCKNAVAESAATVDIDVSGV